MTALTTDARQSIASALAAAGIPAFEYVPATVTVPSVCVIPDDPYVIVDRLGPVLTYSVQYRLHVTAQALDNYAGLGLIESLIDDTIKALPDGVRATRVTPPLIDDLGAQGAAYVSQISVTAHVTEGTP